MTNHLTEILIRKAHLYDPKKGKPYTFIHTIVNNELKHLCDYLLRGKRDVRKEQAVSSSSFQLKRGTSVLEDPSLSIREPKENDPSHRAIQREYRRIIFAMLRKMRTSQSSKMVVALYFRGKTMKEIARQLGLSEANVRNKYFDTMKRMREMAQRLK